MTDRQTLPRSDDPDLAVSPDADRDKNDKNKDQAARKFDLSIAQVVGGGLAAMTAAALGSRLGVGGTIAGAAFASVLTAVASALYTASLRTTSERVRTVWTGSGARTPRSAPIQPEVVPPAPAARRLGLPWRRVLAGAVAVFALAAVLVTGLEALTGQALSGGTGTTVTQVSSSDRSESRQDRERDKQQEDEQQRGDEQENQAPASPEPSEDGASETAPSSQPTPADPEPSAEESVEAPSPSEAPADPARSAAPEATEPPASGSDEGQ